MEAHLIQEVLGLIGVRDARVSGDYIMIRCLFPDRHKGGKDTTASMSISVDPTFQSWVKCFGCQYNKPFVWAVRDLANQTLARGISQMADWVEKNEGLEYSGPRTPQEEIVQDYTPKARYLLKKKMPPEALDLLAQKGVTDERIIGENLLWHPRLKGIVFPFFLRRKGKTMVIGAAIRQLHLGPTTPKYWHVWKFKPRHHLYGEWRVPEWAGQPMMLVEGYFDVLHCWQEGIPCCGLVGKVFTQEKGKFLTTCGIRNTALVLDPDVYESAAGLVTIENSLSALSSLGITARDVRAPLDPKYLSREMLLSFIEEGVHGQTESCGTGELARPRRRFRRRDEPR